VINSTIRNYIRQEEVNILRNRKLTALLKKRGRITFNWSGTGMDWKVRYRRTPLTGFADGDTITFARQDHDKTAFLEWRGYSAADAMTKGEYLMNRGTEAIIKLFDTRNKRLLEDVEDQFGQQFYVDGTAAANAKLLHGIESFCQYTPATVTGVGVVAPSGSFAGLSCVLGAFGGAWSGLWPNGRGDPEYDFWSPLLIDVGNPVFVPGGTVAGPTNELWNFADANMNSVALEAISYAIIKGKKSPSPKGQLDLFLLNDESYRQYLPRLRSKERIVVNNNNSELVSMGFGDVVQQDGKDLTWEYGIPQAVIGYGLNLDQMELRSQQAQVWVPEGPSFDDATKTWRWSIDMFGNVVWNPKYQCKVFNYTNGANETAQGNTLVIS
jgi:hypothetical protein